MDSYNEMSQGDTRLLKVYLFYNCMFVTNWWIKLCCVVLRYVALCCIVLHCVVLHYIALHCILLCYVMLCCVMLCYVICCVVFCCIVFCCDGMQYCVMLCHVMLCYVMLKSSQKELPVKYTFIYNINMCMLFSAHIPV